MHIEKGMPMQELFFDLNLVNLITMIQVYNGVLDNEKKLWG